MATHEELQDSLKVLDQAIDRSNAEKDQLRERLRLIERIALNQIDGDSPTDTPWSEIVGICDGDPNWLQHARANYDLDHARLVQLCRELFEHISDSVRHEATTELIPHMMADHLEEAILPHMVLGEDGRTFRRSQGLPEKVR